MLPDLEPQAWPAGLREECGAPHHRYPWRRGRQCSPHAASVIAAVVSDAAGCRDAPESPAMEQEVGLGCADGAASRGRGEKEPVGCGGVAGHPA